jgi:hypothetical protein
MEVMDKHGPVFTCKLTDKEIRVRAADKKDAEKHCIQYHGEKPEWIKETY